MTYMIYIVHQVMTSSHGMNSIEFVSNLAQDVETLETSVLSFPAQGLCSPASPERCEAARSQGMN